MMMQAMNAEEYHPNPAVRRIRAKLRGMTGMAKPLGENAERDPVVRTEVKQHDDGTAHVVAHRKSGRAEIHEHPHEKAAKEHARTMMSGGGGGGRDMDKTSAMSDPEDDRNEDDRNEAGRDKDNRDDDAMDESNSRSGSRLTSNEKPPKGLAASYLDDDMDRDDDEEEDEDDDYDHDDDEDEYENDAEDEDEDYEDDDDEEGEEQEDEECPSCGWWMADGRCPQCGYEKEEYAYDEDGDDY